MGTTLIFLRRNLTGMRPSPTGKPKMQAYKVAAGLLALGIKKGDRIALFSESRTDWVISELGVLHTGAICVPLSILLKEGMRSEIQA